MNKLIMDLGHIGLGTKTYWSNLEYVFVFHYATRIEQDKHNPSLQFTDYYGSRKIRRIEVIARKA